MPTIARVGNIQIRIYYDDHGVLHFHAISPDFDFKLVIEDCSIISGTGQLRGRDLAVLLQQRAHRRQANLVEDLVLVAEVHVERRRGDAHLVGDLADRCAFVAICDENALRRLQDLDAAKMSVALGLAGRFDGLVEDCFHAFVPITDQG